MCRIRAFIAEHPIQLENPVEPTDDAPLEKEFRRDPQVQIGVEGIGVRDERPRGGTAGQGLQHRCLHLQETPALQRRAHCPHHRNALPGDRAGLRAHDQVDVALADPGLLAHLLVRDR